MIKPYSIFHPPIFSFFFCNWSQRCRKSHGKGIIWITTFTFVSNYFFHHAVTAGVVEQTKFECLIQNSAITGTQKFTYLFPHSHKTKCLHFLREDRIYSKNKFFSMYYDMLIVQSYFIFIFVMNWPRMDSTSSPMH